MLSEQKLAKRSIRYFQLRSPKAVSPFHLLVRVPLKRAKDEKRVTNSSSSKAGKEFFAALASLLVSSRQLTRKENHVYHVYMAKGRWMMPKAVRFDRYGGIDVLQVAEVERPTPGSGQVLVQVKAAGINPGEAAIRQGVMAQRWPATFPSGQGSDLAGIVAGIGEGVETFAVGEEVIGFTNNRASQAEFVVVDATHLIYRPPNVSWEAAGALFVAGTTAYAAVRAISLKEGETVAVSGAAGGVGSIAVQLARHKGAKVIGLASADHHQWLSDHGVIPLAYGEGVSERIRNAAGGSLDAFIDTFGADYVDRALALAVRPERINTIFNFEAVEKYGVKSEGNARGASAAVLAELARLIDRGDLEIPVAHVYPLASVQAAYREIEQRHTLGKIVLMP
jgi:NADPH:quinone reductase-like Zn-dependent oxidoreductase